MTTAILLYSIINFFRKTKSTQIKKVRELEKDSYQILFHTQIGNIPVIYNGREEMFLPTLIKLKAINTKDKWLNKIKKHIENCVIKDMQIPNFERVLKIECKKYASKYNFIIELFSGGNIILTDEKDTIIALQKEIEVHHRILKVGRQYLLPPPRGYDPAKIDADKLLEKINSRKDLFKIFNIDKYTIKEALARSGIASMRRNIMEEDIRKVIKEIRRLIKISEDLDEGISIIKNDKGKLEILPFNPTHIKPLKKFSNILDATSFFIENTLLKEINLDVLTEKERIIREKENLQRTRRKLSEELSLLEKWIPTLYQKIDELNDLFYKAKKGTINGYKVDYDKKIILYPMPGNYLAPLRFDLSPFQAIGYLYNKEYKRRKSGIKNIDKKLGKIEKKVKKIKEIPLERKLLRQRKVLKKKEWYEKFRWFITSEGRLVVGGRDASTNEILIKKHLEKEDIVFHSEFHGSPFAILKNGKKANEKEIYETATFTAAYSRAWKERIYSLDVYYVSPDQISKKAPSGEYLKKGSFMIYGKKNFIRKVPLQLWIGIQKTKSRIFIGPSSAAKANCINSIFFEIYPGDREKREIAELIIKTMKKKKLINIEEGTVEYYIEEIIARLPPGKSSIKTITFLKKMS